MNAVVYALPFLIAYTHASLRVLLHGRDAKGKRHCPKWLGPLIAIALAIPGPQDEAVVALIIAVLVIVKPALRAELRAIWR